MARRALTDLILEELEDDARQAEAERDMRGGKSYDEYHRQRRDDDVKEMLDEGVSPDPEDDEDEGKLQARAYADGGMVQTGGGLLDRINRDLGGASGGPAEAPYKPGLHDDKTWQPGMKGVPQLTDEQRAQILENELNDPARNPDSRAELEREIDRVRGVQRASRTPASPPGAPQRTTPLNQRPAPGSGIAGARSLAETIADDLQTATPNLTGGEVFSQKDEIRPHGAPRDERPLEERPARMVYGSKRGARATHDSGEGPDDIISAEQMGMLPKANWTGEQGVLTNAPAGMVAAGKNAAAGLQYMGAEEERQQRLQALSESSDTAGYGASPQFRALQAQAEARHKQALAAATKAGDEAKLWAAQTKRELQLVTPEHMDTLQQGVWSLIQSAPPTLLGISAGILTRSPVLAMAIAGGGGSGFQGGSTYLEARDKGATHRQAGLAAGIDAILEGAGEALPLKIALKAGTPIAQRIFNVIAAESGQELATQAMQDLNAYLSYNPEITFQEAWENMQVAAIAGALGGVVYGSIGHLADRSNRREEQPAITPDQARSIREQVMAIMDASSVMQPLSAAQQKKEAAAAQAMTHRMEDGTPVAAQVEDGKPVPGVWRDAKGTVYEAERAEPIQAPEPNATWTVNNTPYEVEVTGPGRAEGSARLADGQEVPINALNLDDEAKVILGLMPPPEDSAGKGKPAPTPSSTTRRERLSVRADEFKGQSGSAPGAEARSISSQPTPLPAEKEKPAGAPAQGTPSQAIRPEQPPVGSLPDTAFTENLGKRITEELGKSTMGAVALDTIGFSRDQVAALNKTGLATNGFMDKAQYEKWNDELIRRAPAAKVTGGLTEDRLRQRDERNVRNAERMKAEAVERRKLNVDTDTLTDAIIKMGGIDPAERLDVTGDDKVQKTIPFVGSIFRKGGDTLDGLVRKLEGQGFIPPGEEDDIRKLSDRIREELAGRKKHYSLRRSAESQESERTARLERDKEIYEQMQAAAADTPLEGDVYPDEFEEEVGAPPTGESLAIVDLMSQLDEDTRERLAMRYADKSERELLEALKTEVKRGTREAEKDGEAGGRRAGAPTEGAESAADQGQGGDRDAGEERIRSAQRPAPEDRLEQPQAVYDTGTWAGAPIVGTIKWNMEPKKRGSFLVATGDVNGKTVARITRPEAQHNHLTIEGYTWPDGKTYFDAHTAVDKARLAAERIIRPEPTRRVEQPRAPYDKKPLFIPLNAEHYAAFERGDKTTEYRKYGGQWTEKNVYAGRPVVLSKGYGKQARLEGVVVDAKRAAPPDDPAWKEIYGDATDAFHITIRLGPEAERPEVEQVQPGEKGLQRQRTDKRIKKYLSAKRSGENDTQRIISYRTEATVAYNEAFADKAPQDILDFLMAEHDWAMDRLKVLAPKTYAKLVEWAQSSEEAPAALPPGVGPEEKAAADRDRNEAILTPPAGTAPPLTTTPEPTQQSGLFKPDELPPEPLRRPGKKGDGNPGQGSLFQRSAHYNVTQSEIDAAAAEAEGHLASEAQQDAGNYQKGHESIGPPGATLELAVENEAGTSRRPEWPPLKDHYGYIKDTVGYDKDHLDVFVIPGTPKEYAAWVYVVNQYQADHETFDEHKAIIGVSSAVKAWFPSAGMDGARLVYQRNYAAGWDRGLTTIPMTWAGFRAWATDKGPKGPKGGPLTLKTATEYDHAARNGQIPAPAPGADPQQGGAAPQRDLLGATPLPGTKARSLETVVVEVEKQRTVKVPKGRITIPEDAARAFRELNRWPRERFQMIGVDKRGRPIAFYDLFAGTLTQTSVHPREVWTALYQTPGVAAVWMAHNHPSGIATPSQADDLITQTLRYWLTTGHGIQLRDHIVIAGDQAFSIEQRRRFTIPTDQPETKSVPVLERVVKDRHAAGPALTSPGATRDYIRQLKPTESGLVLMDAQHRATGWWPMGVQEMTRAQWGEAATRVITMVGRNNPAAAIIYAPAGTDPKALEEASRNMKDLLSNAEVRVLDAFMDSPPQMISFAERGLLQELPPYTPTPRAESPIAAIYYALSAARAAFSKQSAFSKLLDYIQANPKAYDVRNKGVRGGRLPELAQQLDALRLTIKAQGEKLDVEFEAARREGFGSNVYTAYDRARDDYMEMQEEWNALAGEFDRLMTIIDPKHQPTFRWPPPWRAPDLSLRARRADALLAQYEALDRQVDAAYEKGDPKAEDLDAELAQLRDRVTGMAEEMSEDEPDAEGELSLERQLAGYYDDWLKSADEAIPEFNGAIKADGTPTPFHSDATTERAVIIDGARDAIAKWGGNSFAASDEHVLAAMRDAYLTAIDRRERIKGAYDLKAQTAGMHPNAVIWELRDNALAKALQNRMRIVRDWRDLPKHVGLYLLQRGATRLARGYADPDTGDGEIWLVSGNLRPGQAARTLLHEAVGHIGVRNVLPREAQKDYDDAMVDIYRSRRQEIAREVASGFLAPYRFDLRNRNAQIAAAGEYVAHMAERGEEQGLWDRLVALLRKIFRNMGLVGEWTDNDILRLLRLSRSSFENGGAETVNGMPLWQLGEPGPIWYSPLERAVGKISMTKAPARQWLATLARAPGVKQSELAWSGVGEWLNAQGDRPVGREQILDYMRDNGVRVNEVLLTDSPQNPNGPAVARARFDRLSVELDALGYEPIWYGNSLAAVTRRNAEGTTIYYYDPNRYPNSDIAGRRTWAELDQSVSRRAEELGSIPRPIGWNGIEPAEPDRVRHTHWTLPGGRAQRELVIYTPKAEQWMGEDDTHYGDLTTRRGIGWVRMNERTDSDGKRVLFVEEIQSKRGEYAHQKGFQPGPVDPASLVMRPAREPLSWEFEHPTTRLVATIWQGESYLQGTIKPHTEAEARRVAARHIEKAQSGMPVPMPFVEHTQDWVGLLLKRVVRYAVDHGFDRVAWTTGEQQNERYGLENHFESLTITLKPDGNYRIEGYKKGVAAGGGVVVEGNVDPAKLSDYIGQELAGKATAALDQAKAKNAKIAKRFGAAVTLEGLDLKVGGAGMRAFYDTIVPQVANKVLKQLGGGRVGTVSIENPYPEEYSDFMEQPGFDITPALEQQAAMGLPMFSLRDNTGYTEVYGVRDGRLLGMARRAFRQGAWEVYLANGTNETLFERGQFRRVQASNLDEVNRIFNRNGLEMRVTRPQNIPVPDASLFDGTWIAPKADTWFKRSVIYFQNRLLLPELYEKAIEEEFGVDMPEETRAHREARLAHPRAAGKIVDFEHDFVERIVDLMKEYGLTIRDVGLYLYARHAPERNAAIEAKNPDNKTGSGISDERANQLIESFRGAGKLAQLQQIGDLATRINRFREQILIDKGLMTQEAVTLMREAYPNYVPLKEITEDEFAQQLTQHAVGGGYQVGRQTVTAFGRFTEAEADYILPGLVAQAKGTIAAGENAEVLRALLRQVSYAPNPDVWSIQKVVWKPYIDRDTGEVRYAPRPIQIDANYSARAISVPVDGERHVIVVKDPRLATAFKTSGLPVPEVFRAIGHITRFYALMATAANPEFVMTNLMRDFQQAMIRLTGEQNPKLAARVAKDMIPALWGAFGGLRQHGQVAPDAGVWQQWYRRFIEAGGQVAYRGLNDAEQQHKDFMTSLAEAGIYQEGIGKAEKVRLKAHRVAKVMGAKWFAKLIVDANGAVENALRLATFKNAIEEGFSEKDAAMLARSVTVDFNLRGEAGARVGALYMFFNANIQGNALLFRSVMNHKAIRALVIMLAVAGMALDAYNRRAARKTRDGRNAYDNIGAAIKEKNLIIMAADGENAYTIPLPFGFNVFYLTGTKVMSVIDGAQKPLEAAGETFMAAVNAFNPFGQSPSSWLGALQLIAPTPLDPAVQAMTNRNFMDKAITPERPKFAPPQADAATYFAGTPEGYVDAAAWANEVTGGNEVRSGWVDISPNMLQHWVRSIFGGAGSFYARVAEYVHGKATGQDVETRNIPFLRRFYYEPKDFELSNRFYENVRSAEIAHLEVQRAMRAGDATKAAALRQEFEWERRKYAEAQAAERAVAQRREQISVIRRNTRYDADQKKRQVEKEQEQMRLIMQQFNLGFEQRDR